MPRRVPKENWRPKGVKSLERNALKVVRSANNALVIAGPGAGKTELLAQRACYLLETGVCAMPKRILAISFKRDAAKNLADRVAKRVGPELAGRFDSLTFDAFAKGLVDRFLNGIPEFFRPSSDYVIDFKIENKGPFKALMEAATDEAKGRSLGSIQALHFSELYKNYFVGKVLPETPPLKGNLETVVAYHIWKNLLRTGKRSALNFHMIGRLADLLLRSNPAVLSFLRQTYAYVFLDEFQDTSGIHYALTKTAFQGSGSVLTAVGDEKQKIMVWAGALHGVFQKYTEDFGAEAHPLKMNYRSARELVRVQSYLINSLEPNGEPPEAADDGSNGEGECLVLNFANHEEEAEHLASIVQKAVDEEGLQPRDLCILTRSRPKIYSEEFHARLTDMGIASRVENDFQDLLTEPVIESVLHFFKFTLNKKCPDSWAYIVGLYIKAVGATFDDHEYLREAELRILELRKILRTELRQVTTKEQILSIVKRVISLYGSNTFQRLFPQYRQGTFLNDKITECVEELHASRKRASSWKKAIEDFEGVNSVPIMTVHKSKGLEYHTVIFIGLEDSALFSFSKAENEETCGFFVALSRAKMRAIFTFCHRRPDATSGRLTLQRKTAIDPLYRLLREAGVESHDI